MTDGFRVLGWRGARSGSGPAVIAYTLDPQTLAIRDLDGDVEGIFGFPREQWSRPEFYFETLHPDDLDAARAFCRIWKDDRQSHELQYRLIDAGGRVRWVHEIISVRDDGHGGPDLRGVMVDVTDCLAGNIEPGGTLRVRQELQRIVAEELARPVRMIGDYAGMLGRHLSTRRDDVGSDYAMGVHEGIERLTAVLARLMRAAQSGRMTQDELADGLAAIRTWRDGT